MRYQDKIDAGEATDVARAPSHCPACRSPEVKTASKVVTAASYWRCEACGEVWNVARLNAATRNSGSWSFRRY